MTICSFPHGLRLKLLVMATTALVASPSCMSAPKVPRATPAVAIRPVKARYPDPRYRPPLNVSELQAIASRVAKASGREIRWRLVLGEDPGPLARVRGGLDDCTITIHPIGARKLPPNTWAFIFGHEFAHLVENLGNHSQNNPSNELKADIAGARYAMAAGYRLEAFLGWVLTEPNHRTKSHGSPRDRVSKVGAHFGIPQNVIQAEAKRYSANRAKH